MIPIPPKLRKDLADDPYMRACIIPDGKCDGCIEWHHAIIYGNKRLQKKYAILPLCTFHHRGANGTIQSKDKLYAEWVALIRAGSQINTDCPKVDWTQRKKYLDSLFTGYAKK